MMARPGRLFDGCGTDSGRRVLRGARLPHSRGEVVTRKNVAQASALLCLCAAGLLLSSCSQLAEAYRIYDANLERELVAGHDDARGNYAEFRWSPKAKADGKAVLP